LELSGGKESSQRATPLSTEHSRGFQGGHLRGFAANFLRAALSKNGGKTINFASSLSAEAEELGGCCICGRDSSFLVGRARANFQYGWVVAGFLKD